MSSFSPSTPRFFSCSSARSMSARGTWPQLHPCGKSGHGRLPLGLAEAVPSELPLRSVEYRPPTHSFATTVEPKHEKHRKSWQPPHRTPCSSANSSPHPPTIVSPSHTCRAPLGPRKAARRWSSARASASSASSSRTCARQRCSRAACGSGIPPARSRVAEGVGARLSSGDSSMIESRSSSVMGSSLGSGSGSGAAGMSGSLDAFFCSPREPCRSMAAALGCWSARHPGWRAICSTRLSLARGVDRGVDRGVEEQVEEGVVPDVDFRYIHDPRLIIASSRRDIPGQGYSRCVQ